MTQPAVVTAAAGMDILCHALESYTARRYTVVRQEAAGAAGALLRRQPDLRHVVGEGAVAAGRRLPARRCTTATTPRRATQMALAATFAGLGFGNAGVHIPHANAYPIAGRVRDFRPEGYPHDEPMVPHGMAVSLTAPEAFRFTFEASPERHLRAAPAARARPRVRRTRRACPTVLAALMRDIGIPNGLGRGRLRRGRRRRPGRGLAEAAAAAGHRPARGDRRGPGRHLPRLARALVTAGADLVEALRRAGVADVDASTLARAMYASDASLYRVRPAGRRPPPARRRGRRGARGRAARPASPLTMRGAGTSIAGNAVGPGIVVDTSGTSTGCSRSTRRRAPPRVQPGVVHAALQRAVAPHGLRFGPDPSTHTRCTDRRDDRQQRLRLAGARLRPHRRQRRRRCACCSATARRSRPGAGPARRRGRRLNALVDEHLGTVRTEFGRFGRQVSRLLAASTCCPSGADVRPLPGRHRGHPRPGPRRHRGAGRRTPGRARAGGARLPDDGRGRGRGARRCSPHGLTACEGLDSADRRRGRAAGRAVPALPRGRRLAVRRGRRRRPPARSPRRPRAWSPRRGALAHRVVTDPAEAAALWRIREDGAGLAARTPAHARRTPAGRTPPSRPRGSAPTCATSTALLREHGLDGVPYGHFGDGCVHVRIDFGFDDAGGRPLPGVPRPTPRSLVRTLRRLAVRRARRRPGPLRAAAADVLRRVARRCSPRSSAIFDPDNLLNPGVLVDPAPLDADLRLARAASPGPHRAAARPRRRLARRRRAPLHRRRQVPGRQHRHRAA